MHAERFFMNTNRSGEKMSDVDIHINVQVRQAIKNEKC